MPSGAVMDASVADVLMFQCVAEGEAVVDQMMIEIVRSKKFQNLAQLEFPPLVMPYLLVSDHKLLETLELEIRILFRAVGFDDSLRSLMCLVDDSFADTCPVLETATSEVAAVTANLIVEKANQGQVSF